MNCPECTANETIRSAVAYMRGTVVEQRSASGSHSSHAIAGTAVGYSHGSSTISGTSIQQTALARNLAPPVKPKFSDALAGWCGLVVIGYLVFRFLGGFSLSLLGCSAAFISSAAFWTTVVLSGPMLIYVLDSYFTEEKQFQAAIKEWNREWICLRCGSRWLPE